MFAFYRRKELLLLLQKSQAAPTIKERDDYSNDEHDICDTIQLCSFQRCQQKVTAGGICDGHSYNDLFCCKPSGGTSDDEEKAVESFGHNNTTAGNFAKVLKRLFRNSYVECVHVVAHGSITRHTLISTDGKVAYLNQRIPVTVTNDLQSSSS